MSLEGNTLAPAVLPMYDPVEMNYVFAGMQFWKKILKKNDRRLNESVNTIKDTDDIK